MPTVTSLSPQIKNPQRINMFVDGQFFCGLDQDTLLKHGIKVNQQYSNTELEVIFQDSELGKLYNRALDYLARRPRSMLEMRQYLQTKLPKYKFELDEDKTGLIVNSILERLETLNYLNDEEFVRWWIDQRTSGRRGMGLRRIQSELLQKGIPTDIVVKVWHAEEKDENTLIEKEFEKIRHRYDVNSLESRRRLVGYLQRKGFRWDTIQSILSPPK